MSDDERPRPRRDDRHDDDGGRRKSSHSSSRHRDSSSVGKDRHIRGRGSDHREGRHDRHHRKRDRDEGKRDDGHRRSSSSSRHRSSSSSSRRENSGKSDRSRSHRRSSSSSSRHDRDDKKRRRRSRHEDGDSSDDEEAKAEKKRLEEEEKELRLKLLAEQKAEEERKEEEERKAIAAEEARKKRVLEAILQKSMPARVTGPASRFIYKCTSCGSQVLESNIDIQTMPKRKTDNSTVLSHSKTKYLLSIVSGATKKLKRPGGMEMQYRLNCNDCGVAVAYRPTPVDAKCKFTYILDAAVEEVIARTGPVRGDEMKQYLAATNKGEFESVICTTHGKNRSLKHMTEVGDQAYACKASSSCLTRPGRDGTGSFARSTAR
eukprot:TRINITY_DN2698_c0_g1_i1.p1 TRINITY_DN2698_c0_g1~~TRINITY_DN2698_c0_g1_i1.p1  ORF type:complete len:421 (+),score=73.75 TRINITY_DN2698_c0_g1_i1:136-1263(+)